MKRLSMLTAPTRVVPNKRACCPLTRQHAGTNKARARHDTSTSTTHARHEHKHARHELALALAYLLLALACPCLRCTCLLLTSYLRCTCLHLRCTCLPTPRQPTPRQTLDAKKPQRIAAMGPRLRAGSSRLDDLHPGDIAIQFQMIAQGVSFTT